MNQELKPVHPHRYGEHMVAMLYHQRKYGSSPQIRGTLTSKSIALKVLGSSPQIRGTLSFAL